MPAGAPVFHIHRISMNKTFTTFLTAALAATTASEAQAQTFDSNGFAENAGAEATIDQKYQKPPKVDGVYEVANAGQLYWFFCQTTQEVDPRDTTKYISQNSNNAKLTADIRINSSVANGIESELRNWVLLTEYKDSAKYTFRGSFNGDGHTIDGVWCEAEGDADASLFNVVADGGNVKNLTIGSDSKFFTSKDYDAASVAIDVYGDIISVTNKASVSATMAGGIAVYCYGKITACQNDGNIGKEIVPGGLNFAGGICAQMENGLIRKCINNGNVTNARNGAGGICGICGKDSGISNCLNAGTIGGQWYAGGIVCHLEAEDGDEEQPSVDNCSNVGNIVVNDTEYGGGCVAVCEYGNISHCYFLQTEGINDSLEFCPELTLGESSSENNIGRAMNEEQYASGEVALELGIAWGQNVDNGEEAMPYPEPGNAARVYKVDLLSCNGSGEVIGITFSNTNKPKTDSHHFDEDGVCTVEGCGAKKTALLRIDADGGKVETYDLTGRRTFDKARGLVIRRQGGKSRLTLQ